jgi:rhamnopyranosyl-N-acetylglucosaminyl-diphospho-decaprenol beta-1,3/1,4-galactofuranosyltransferase
MKSSNSNYSVGVILTQGYEYENQSWLDLMIDTGLDKILVIVNREGQEFVPIQKPRVEVIFTGKNLGGAGGFAFGMKTALQFAPEWVWTCDNDAIPETSGLVTGLLSQARLFDLDVIAPLIVSPEDKNRLSFPFRKGCKRTWERGSLRRSQLIHNQAHLFNGTLFKSSVLKNSGFPMEEMYIRGDEQEYLFRIQKAGFKVGTAVNLAIIHPSGENELRPTFFGILRACVPNVSIKFAYQIRNRGYITRKYRRIDWLAIDLFRYTSFFLFRRNPSFWGLVITARIYLKGVMGKIEIPPYIDPENWEHIYSLK